MYVVEVVRTCFVSRSETVRTSRREEARSLVVRYRGDLKARTSAKGAW